MKITEKQIEEACNTTYKTDVHNTYFGNCFRLGVKFAVDQLSFTPDQLDLLKRLIRKEFDVCKEKSTCQMCIDISDIIGINTDEMKNDLHLSDFYFEA